MCINKKKHAIWIVSDLQSYRISDLWLDRSRGRCEINSYSRYSWWLWLKWKCCIFVYVLYRLFFHVGFPHLFEMVVCLRCTVPSVLFWCWHFLFLLLCVCVVIVCRGPNGSLIDWFTDVLSDWPTDYGVTDWLSDWRIDCGLSAWITNWLNPCALAWLIDWSTDSLTHWLTFCQMDSLTDGRLAVCWLFVCLTLRDSIDWLVP